MSANTKQMQTFDFAESFFNYSLELLCVANPEGYFVKLNPKWSEVLGFAISDMLNSPFVDFIHPEDRDASLDQLSNVLKGGEVHGFVNRFRTKNNEYKWLEWNAHFLENENLVLASARDISDRILIGEKVRENEYKLDLLIKYSSSAVALVDNELRFEFVSEKWKKEVRKNEKELIGKNILDLFPHLKSDKKWEAIISSSREGKINRGFQDKVINQKGHVGWYNWELRPWYNQKNEIAGLYISIENVTEMMESHIKLRNSERMLKESQKIAKLGSWEYDPYTGDVEWNDEMYEILGVDREDHDGKIDLLFELAHPDDRDRLRATVKKSSEVKNTVPIEYRTITPMGEIRHLYARGGSQLDDKGKVMKFYGTFQDITDQKLTEQAIINSEKKFRGILEAGPDAFLIINSEGLIDLANKKAEKLFGYSKEQFKNQKLEIFIRENYKNDAECLKKYFSPDSLKENSTMELVGVNKNGNKFPVEVSINPLETELGLFFNMAIRDITERKNAENLHQIKTEELEIKNKELEQFAFVASHDLQEPLQTISSFVDLIGKEYQGKLDGSADKYISFITDATSRMKILIKSLLDYSRIGRSQDFDQVDCNQLVRLIIEDLSTVIFDSNAKINIEKLPIILGHEYELKLVFQNLISNAIKFCAPDTIPEITINAEKEEDCWKFMVQDNGIGIDKKHKDKIFVIFQRLHNRKAYEGAGIGLAHCKKIVELHGGKIWVVSEAGKGSTFYFTIKV